jgi:ATP-dependent RNA helicase DeaD
MITTFKDFLLSAELKRALETLGLTTPTEIQAKAIPLLLEQKKIDFHGQAQTGTGKTLAFGLPLLESIDTASLKTQALIVAPTRELVLQICESLAKAAQFTRISVVPIYGGVSIERQLRDLRRGAHVIIGTPGRLNDHLRRRSLSLKDLETLVLDEADIMLDMGFRQEIEEILTYAPKQRNIWLFSATVKQGIEELKAEHMSSPVVVRTTKQQTTTSNTLQYYCVVPSRLRLPALCRFIDKAEDFYGVIFCQTKILASEVAETLSRRGYGVNALHGDMDQNIRNSVITKFKNKEFGILVATDVAARGIDVSGLTHVVNFSLPEDQESYVHRIGRTGRAGKDGTAITFIGKSEIRRLQQVARRFSANINPIDVPSLPEVMQARTAQAHTYLAGVLDDSTTKNKAADNLRDAIAKLSQEQLVTICSSMVHEKFLKGYDGDHDIHFGSSTDTSPRTQGSEDKQEIVLHIGSEDGITRQDIVQYCTSDTIDMKLVERIRVIKKRSFLVVPMRIATALAQELKNKRIQGKKIRVAVMPFEDIHASSDNHRPSYRPRRGGDYGSRDRFEYRRR